MLLESRAAQRRRSEDPQATAPRTAETTKTNGRFQRSGVLDAVTWEQGEIKVRANAQQSRNAEKRGRVGYPVVADGDERAVVEERDEHQHQHRELEELGPRLAHLRTRPHAAASEPGHAQSARCSEPKHDVRSKHSTLSLSQTQY